MGASAIASAAVLAWAVFSANPAVDGALRSPNLLPWSWGAPTVADTTPDDLIGRAQGRDPFASHNHVDPPAPTKPVEVVDEQILRVMGTVVDSSGASFAICQLGAAPAVILHVGQRIGEYELRRVEKGGAMFLTLAGDRVERRVARAGT